MGRPIYSPSFDPYTQPNGKNGKNGTEKPKAAKVKLPPQKPLQTPK